MDLINMGSGYSPLRRVNVDSTVFTRVINFDPLDDSERARKFLNAVRHDPTLHVLTKHAQLDSTCKDGGTNLVLAVSPYGFAAIDRLTDRKLAPGGWVLLVGSSRNKYIKLNNACSVDVRAQYAEVRHYPTWLTRFVGWLLANYVSQTASDARVTPLDTFRVLQKRMPI